MKVKIALIMLLVILIATTIVITTNAVFRKVPSIKRIVTNFAKDGFKNIILLGDPRGGGWPW